MRNQNNCFLCYLFVFYMQNIKLTIAEIKTTYQCTFLAQCKKGKSSSSKPSDLRHWQYAVEYHCRTDSQWLLKLLPVFGPHSTCGDHPPCRPGTGHHLPGYLSECVIQCNGKFVQNNKVQTSETLFFYVTVPADQDVCSYCTC